MGHSRGGMSSLSGANAYERSKYPNAADTFAKVQFYVQGADHNYFNTVWTNDDGASYSTSPTGQDVACGEHLPNNIRLFPTDQRKVGLGLMAAFLRDYLGYEKQFEPLMTGGSGLPSSMCPTLRGVACGELVKTSYIAPAAARQDIIRPDAVSPLAVDAAGGGLTATASRRSTGATRTATRSRAPRSSRARRTRRRTRRPRPTAPTGAS